MIEIINRITPIILLLIVGKWLQLKNIISSQTVAEIKKIVVNLALPAVLFSSFSTIELQAEYFWFIPVIVFYCILLYVLGLGLSTIFQSTGNYFPFMITGFEYGMLGVSLFGAAYGLNQIGKIAIVDLGQEIFIWFIYVALLIHRRDGETSPGKLIKMFSTSPVIVAILAGLLFNFLGLSSKLEAMPLLGGLMDGVALVGSLTIPLILMVVGYGIQVDMHEFFHALRVILIRLLINIPVALLLNRFLVRGLLGLDKGFEAALFTLLILPPPFILTLFMNQDKKDELHRVDNTLTLHTIITVVVFIVYYALNPVI